MNVECKWPDIMKYTDFPRACVVYECRYLRVIPDMYGTGDSPTGYECMCNSLRLCPFYEETKDHLESLKYEE